MKACSIFPFATWLQCPSRVITTKIRLTNPYSYQNQSPGSLHPIIAKTQNWSSSHHSTIQPSFKCYGMIFKKKHVMAQFQFFFFLQTTVARKIIQITYIRSTFHDKSLSSPKVSPDKYTSVTHWNKFFSKFQQWLACLLLCRLYNKLQDLDSLQQENGFFLQLND